MFRVFNSRKDELERCPGCGFYGHRFNSIGIVASDRIIEPGELTRQIDNGEATGTGMPRARQRTNFQSSNWGGRHGVDLKSLLTSCDDNCRHLPDGQHGNDCMMTQVLKHAIKFAQNTKYSDLRRAITKRDNIEKNGSMYMSPIDMQMGQGVYVDPEKYTGSSDMSGLIRRSSPNGIVSRPEVLTPDNPEIEHPAKSLFFTLLNSLGYRRGAMGGALQHPDVNPVAPIPGFQVKRLDTREPTCPNCLEPIKDDEPSLRLERIKQAGYPVISARRQTDERRFRKFIETTTRDESGIEPRPRAFISEPDTSMTYHDNNYIKVRNPVHILLSKIPAGRQAHWQDLYNKFQTAAQINWNTVPSPVPPGNLGELDAIGPNDMRLTGVVRMPMHVGCLAGKHPALQGEVPAVSINNCPALGRTNRWSTNNGGAAWITSGYGGGARFRRALNEPIPGSPLQLESGNKDDDLQFP